jgi:hypothetical protein
MLGNLAASVTMTDEMAAGPRRDGTGLGTFVPTGLVVGGGVGMRIGGVGTPMVAWAWVLGPRGNHSNGVECIRSGIQISAQLEAQLLGE